MHLARGEGPVGFCRLFAIKTIHEHYAHERSFVDMFFDEARLAARIHHPNAISVYEVGTDQGLHYIAMDYVNGETLAATTQRTWGHRPPFPMQLAIHIMEGICEALHTAHELTNNRGQPLNVVHRDVSPQNILIGYDGIPRIADFGVAKATDQLAHTRPGSQKGKFAYMAPEQVLGRDLDRRVDVFALGIILWECITGRRLFKKKSDLATMKRIRKGHVPDVRRFRADAPEALARIVDRALAMDRNDRFETARAFAQELRFVAVKNNLLSATPDLEHYMRSIFAETYVKRLEIVRRASEEGFLDSTGAMELRPTFDFKPTLSDADEPDPRVTLGGADGDEHGSTPRDWPFVPPVAQFFGRPLRFLGVLFLASATAVIATLWAVRTRLEEPAITIMPVATPSEPPPAQEPAATANAPEPPARPVPPPALKAARRSAGPPSTPSPTAPAIDPVPSNVRLEFNVHPETATIRIDGKTISGDIVRPRSNETLAVVVEAPGFLRKTQFVTPDRNQRIAITLTAQKPIKRKTGKPKPRRPERRLLLNGDDL